MAIANRPAAPDRFLIGIVAGAVILIVAGIAAVGLASRTGRVAVADPASPVGVVQAYVEALRAGDPDRADEFLTRAAREAQARRSRDLPISHPSPSNVERRILIEPLRAGPDAAEVKVTISTFRADADPFSSGAYHSDVTVRLIREDGVWRITRPIETYEILS